MEHDEAECQAPERPILCINNCGFFGRPATMNMCSKCHKDHILKQEHAKLAASSIDNAVNGSQIGVKDELLPGAPNLPPAYAARSTAHDSGSTEGRDSKSNDGPSRCGACSKRVGLTGFACRCGDLFCAAHRYSDRHGCPFDYRTAARDAIAKANPVVKAEKLDKI